MGVEIETKSGIFEIADDPDDSILFTGLAAGLSLPYECASGTCGTCRARVMSGEVTVSWNDAPGFRKLKRERGDVLMCQARPTGRCVIRVPSDVAHVDGPHPRRRRGHLLETRALTADVTAITVAIDQPMAFEAGQFVTIKPPGVTGGRAYSMVNFDRDASRLVFVVKRKPGGAFSDWLSGEAAIGQSLELFGPLGRATFRPAVDDRDVVLIGGGSGIAGLMSILAASAQAGHFVRRRGDLYFGVRTLADGFYLAELHQHVQRASGALTVTLVLSEERPTTATHPVFDGIALDHGLVHEAAGRSLARRGAGEALSNGAPGSHDPVLAFVAGPPLMVDGAIRMLLTEARLPVNAIRYDRFG